MDRCDAAAHSWQAARELELQRLYEDPRYWCGQLYTTVVDRMVAEAKHRLRVNLDCDWATHRLEMQANIKLGDSRSIFWPTGHRK
jgi:hypothetical protein